MGLACVAPSSRLAHVCCLLGEHPGRSEMDLSESTRLPARSEGPGPPHRKQKHGRGGGAAGRGGGQGGGRGSGRGRAAFAARAVAARAEVVDESNAATLGKVRILNYYGGSARKEGSL